MPRKVKPPPTVAEMSKVINEFVYDKKPEWKWGDDLDLSTAKDVSPEQVKIVLSRIKQRG